MPLNFENLIQGHKVIKVERFSKYIILSFSNGIYCLLHLGMSGTIHLVQENKKNAITNTSFYNSPLLPKKHNHVEIIFVKMKSFIMIHEDLDFFQILKDKKSLKKDFRI